MHLKIENMRLQYAPKTRKYALKTKKYASKIYEIVLIHIFLYLEHQLQGTEAHIQKFCNYCLGFLFFGCFHGKFFNQHTLMWS